MGVSWVNTAGQSKLGTNTQLNFESAPAAIFCYFDSIPHERLAGNQGLPAGAWRTSPSVVLRCNLDLIVWSDETGAPVGFQFCYQDRRIERALTWKPDTGFRHATVDDGESPRSNYPRTPVLNDDGPIDFPRLQKLFADASSSLPADIVEFISTRLLESAYQHR